MRRKIDSLSRSELQMPKGGDYLHSSVHGDIILPLLSAPVYSFAEKKRDKNP